MSIKAVRSMLEDGLCVRIPIHLFTHDVFPHDAQMYR